MEKMPVIFVGHGDPMRALKINEMTKTLNKIGKEIIKKHGEPKAILTISAHWFTKDTFIQSAEFPKQIYDMYGFPDELYEVKYPVKGSKELTKDVEKILGNEVKINDDWGIDHGTWTVFVHMFPEAKIPVVQLSVNANLSANKAYKLGEKLAKLREKSYLIVGSGNIVHNLRAISWEHIDQIGAGYDWAFAFRETVNQAITTQDDKTLVHYDQLGEKAELSVPTPDHYLPLLYIMALREPQDEITFFNDNLIAGSLSMTSVLVG